MRTRPLASARLGGRALNALQHAFGHMAEGLSSPERAHFLDQLGELRAGRLPLVGTLTLLRNWVLRFDADYVHRRTYREPYPRELAGRVGLLVAR